MGADPTIPTLQKQIADLSRRIRDMETNSQRLGNSAIAEGALIVRDAAGNDRVVMGLLPNGDYGLALMNGAGQIVPLSESAFGTAFATAGTFSYSAPSGSGVFWTATAGPEVVVTTTSGRLKVDLTASVAGGSEGALSVDITDEDTGEVVLQPSVDAGSPIGVVTAPYMGQGMPTFVSGLWTGPPGRYRVRARFGGVRGAGIGWTIVRRSLTVAPV